MPALPWVQREAIDPSATYLAMASRLPLKAYRSIPGFLRGSTAIRRQLASTSGLVGYALNADLIHKTFWTFSLWQSREDLDSFARTDPHKRIIARIRPLMAPTRFEFFSVSGDKFPMSWDQMKAPLR